MKHNYFPQQLVMLYHTFKNEQRNVKKPPMLQFKMQLAFQKFKKQFLFLRFRSKTNYPLHLLQHYWLPSS